LSCPLATSGSVGGRRKRPG